MAMKVLLRIIDAIKKICWDGVFGKPAVDLKSKDEQGGQSDQKRSLRQKIGSTVAEWECLPCSGSFSSPRKFPTVGDSLEASDLLPRLIAHHGIPATTCTMAFDPTLNLLATGTQDGRIKIFGDTGIEILLQSPAQASYRFLQFLHNQSHIISITTKNDIEVWDLGARSLAASHKWDTEITSIAVIQGSPFFYVGDEIGTVQVLQYDFEKTQLLRLPYSIPVNLTLGDGMKALHVPPVIGILPQPHGEFERVLIAYGNGLIVLWHLQGGQALAMRGGTEFQLKVMSGRNKKSKSNSNSTDSLYEQEDKELCCICWTCPYGSLFAAGYADGDVWLWSVLPVSKPKGWSDNEGSALAYSRTPALKIHIGSGRAKAPIFMLKWWSGDEVRQGRNGYLCVFGGGEFASQDVLKIIPLKDIDTANQKLRLELPLGGPLADLMAVPSSGSLPSVHAAFLVLTSPGKLQAYDINEMSSFFTDLREGKASSMPEPIPVKLSIADSLVTIAKLILIPSTGKIADDMLQIPRVFKGSTWPFIGRKQIASLHSAQTRGGCFYLTGHHDGSVNVWDVSTPYIYSVCSLEYQNKLDHLGKEASPVSALDFCSVSGYLAIGNENGLIWLYRISNESHEVHHDRSSEKEEGPYQNSGFHFITNFNAHQRPVCCIAISAGQERLAAGCEGGMVSLIDLKTHSFLYHGKCFSSNFSEIVSLQFAPIPLLTSGFSTPLSPATPHLLSRQSPSLTTQAVALFVMTKDSCVVALHGDNGVCLNSGPLQPKHPSSAVSLYLLDTSGAPVTVILEGLYETLKSPLAGRHISSRDTLQVHRQGPDQYTKTMNCSPNVQSKSGSEERSFDSAVTDVPLMSSVSDQLPNRLLLLLCAEDCLRVYSMSSFLQGVRAPLSSIKLHRPCCWTSTFQTQSKGFGLVVLYKTGELEFRCLPSMDILKQTSMSACLQWDITLDPNLLKTMSCTTNGQIALVDKSKELIFLSLLDAKHDQRVLVPLAPVQSKDMLEVASDESITSSQPRKKKRLLAGVMKEMKGGGRKNVTGPSLAELAQFFGASDSTAIRFSPSNDGTISDSSNSLDTRNSELDIDDIDVDDEPISNQTTPRSKGSHGHNSLVRKVKQTFRGQKKDPGYYTSDSDAMDYESSGERHVRTLKETKDSRGQHKPNRRGQKKDSNYYTSDSDAMDYESSGDGRIRSLNEIKASYGHRRHTDAAETAGQAKDKLFQRGEKLQGIARRTAQMQQNAEDFQSLAEELVKTFEKKKWGF